MNVKELRKKSIAELKRRGPTSTARCAETWRG
jgi:hypothetical protein